MSIFSSSNISVLITPQKLQERIANLGLEITKDYKNKDLIVVGILNGCFVFLADLVREIDLPITTDFMGLSSYGASTKSSGIVQITKDLSKIVEGKHLLIVEDIIDTGLTMSYLLENLETRRPASVKICSLLSKPTKHKTDIPIEYLGFSIEDKFVVGYGLDFDGRYRNLPYIGVVENIE
jgi:hypoxanthine phosphoribosyltransferase